MKNHFEIEEATSSVLLRFGSRMVVDTLILMLALGGLGHRLDIPYLFKFDFWTCLLVIVVAQSLAPRVSIGKLIMKPVTEKAKEEK